MIMAYTKIFNDLLTIFPYEIIFKILITHKGLQHPTIKLLQPTLLNFHTIREMRQNKFDSYVLSCQEPQTDFYIQDEDWRRDHIERLTFNFNCNKSILYKDLINLNSYRISLNSPLTLFSSVKRYCWWDKKDCLFWDYILKVSRREGIMEFENIIEYHQRRLEEGGHERVPEKRNKISDEIIIDENKWLYSFGRIISDIQKFIILVDDEATSIYKTKK